MEQRIKNMFHRRFAVIWIAATVLFIGFGTQLGADEHIEPNKSNWVPTNGPYGGEILAFYAAPKAVLLVGTEGGGIFRSTDRGDTWTPVNAGLRFEPGEDFQAVTAFAQKGNVLYAGTRDGLYASTDAGNRWQQVSSFQKYESISGLVVIGDRIYVGTLNRGVWYSDDGDLWIPVNEGLGSSKVDELFKKQPRAIPNAIGFGPMLIRKLIGVGRMVIAATDKAIFRKADNEDSWTLINTDAISEPVNIASVNRARIEAGLDPLPKHNFPAGIQVQAFAAMEHLLYMSVYMGRASGLFRSNDAGQSWTYITPAEMTQSIEALAVYGGTLYASSGQAVYRSEDRGDSWTIVSDGAHGMVSMLLAVNEDTVFVGTSNGVFRTMDGGDSWMERNTGITNASVSKLEVIGDKIYAGHGSRVVHSIDGGKSWHSVERLSAPTNYGVTGLAVSDGELYIAACGTSQRHPDEVVGGIYRLDKESNAWVELIALRNLTNSECMEVVGTTFYIGTLRDGVFQWKQGSGPWATNLGLEHHYITALVGNGETVYAGAEGDEIYRLNKGLWQPIHAKEMDGSMSVKWSSMSDLKWVGSTLYATFWNKGVFLSRDGGDSWASINEGLNETNATSIGTDGTAVYVSTFHSVFQWGENEGQWKLIGALPYQVGSLAVLDGFLYAGTYGGGVYKIRIEK